LNEEYYDEDDEYYDDYYDDDYYDDDYYDDYYDNDDYYDEDDDYYYEDEEPSYYDVTYEQYVFASNVKFTPKNLLSFNPDFLAIVENGSSVSFGTLDSTLYPPGYLVTVEEDYYSPYYLNENNAYVTPNQIEYASWADPEYVNDGYFDVIDLEEDGDTYKIIVVKEKDPESY
jgi:hypothetical protein